jgi:hypothetical protein
MIGPEIRRRRRGGRRFGGSSVSSWFVGRAVARSCSNVDAIISAVPKSVRTSVASVFGAPFAAEKEPAGGAA